MQMQQATANRMWVDQVQSRVLQRSSLVTNVVTRFNMLAERNTRSARRSRLRIFSEIALDFSFSQIRELPLVLPLLPNRLLPWRYANGCITKHAVIRGLSLPEVWDLKSHTSKKQATVTINMISELLCYVTDDGRASTTTCLRFQNSSRVVHRTNVGSSFGSVQDAACTPVVRVRAETHRRWEVRRSIKKGKFMEVLFTHSITQLLPYPLIQSPTH